MLFNLNRKLRLVLALVPFLFLASCDKDEETDPKKRLNTKAVGESARDLLSAEKYGKLMVELQYAEGFAPTPTAVNYLRSFIESRLNKPGGVIIKQIAVPAPGKATYTVNDLIGIEDRHRTEFTRTDTIAIYFFFADGRHNDDTDNSKVLGVAYRNTSMALFEQTIQQNTGGLFKPERSMVESVVLQHELGHILGLVNAGTPMTQHHQDEPHGRHCTNDKCLMHYTVETGSLIQSLLGGYTPVLDQNCLNDLKANGGK